MPRKKNILVAGTTYPRWKDDSVPAFLQFFAENMVERGNAVSVLVPHYKGAQRNEQYGGLHVHRFRYMVPASAQDIVYGGGGIFKIKKTPWYALKLASFCTSEFFAMLFTVLRRRITVINAHWAVPQGFLAIFVKWLTGRKVVVSVHGADVLGLEGKLMTRVKRFVLRHADYVVANSSMTATVCQDIYPEVKLATIPMGVDLKHFRPAPKPQTLVHQCQLEHTFTLLFVGRLTTVKGVVYLLEALVKLQRDEVPYRLLILGEGPERPRLEKFVKEHGLEESVIFAGWKSKDELLDYYHVADVFVGPSLHEALGLVFVEAQATGLPVVASNVDGIPYVVDDGETGFLVEKKNSEQLYDKLKELYDKPKLRQRMAKQTQVSITKQFSWERVAERYDALFDEVSR